MFLFVISSSDELLVPQLVVKNDLMLGDLSLTICYPFPYEPNGELLCKEN